MFGRLTYTSKETNAMNKHLKLATGLLLLALLGVTYPAAAQAPGALDVAKALAAAQNANDPAAMRALIAPNATFVQSSPAGDQTQGREAWIAGNTGAENSQVNILQAQQTAPGTVVADASLSGGDIPPLPHPFTVHVVFTVVNGRVTHAVITTSPQTQQDIAATLGPPPAQQTPSPTDLVLASADAQNANDPAAMRALIAPDALFVTTNGPFAGTQNRDDFIAGNTGAHNSQIAVSNVRQIDANTATADAVICCGDVPQLPHPFLLHVRITVANGLVTHAEVQLDAQTVKDLEALGPPPGMPSTGQPAAWLLAGLLALAALGAGLAGLTLRARRSAR
jgi:hypothetical protein